MSDSQDDGLRELYESFARRLEAEPEMGIEGMRSVFEEWHLATTEPAGVTYREAADAPVPATWCIPPRSEDGRAIVYAHGGGFVVGSRHSHRKLGGHLATHCATPVLVVDYRRAPEHPYPAQVEDTISAAKWLMKTDGLAPADIAFAGDSAGGNIAVSSGLRLSEEGLAPAAVVAMSPWFDMANSGRSLDENAAYDAMVELPPTLVTTSQHETLRDDATRFTARAEAAGRDIRLLIEPNAQHVFQMAAGRSAAADRSLERIGRWVQAKFSR
jgi:monoterpene epsilon-lactone hydrolase